MKIQKITNDTTAGYCYALIALIFWGLMPLYWYQLHNIPASLVLAHRSIWAALSLTFLIIILGKSRAVFRTLKQYKIMLWLVASAFIIGLNWWLFLVTIQANKVLEVSLGYYLNPLITIFLGRIFFKEKLQPLQWTAIIFACFAVAYQSSQLSDIPWFGLFIAISFSIYSSLKKGIAVDGLLGLTIETLILLPFALIYLFYNTTSTSLGQFNLSIWEWSFLIGSGFATALPLIWFANAAKRLPLNILGFLNYISPTISLLLAVFYFKEPFTSVHAVSFIAIGIGLMLYSLHLFNLNKKKNNLV